MTFQNFLGAVLDNGYTYLPSGAAGGAMTGALLGTGGMTGLGGLAGATGLGSQMGTAGGLSEQHNSGGAYGLGTILRSFLSFGSRYLCI